jgi:hypothetical protein
MQSQIETQMHKLKNLKKLLLQNVFMQQPGMILLPTEPLLKSQVKDMLSN